MKQSTPKPAAHDQSPPKPTGNSRQKWLALIACLAIAGLLGVVVYQVIDRPIEPPAVDLSQADPEAAQAIESARDAVLRNSKSAAAWGELAQMLHVHGFKLEALACYAEAERRDPTDPRWPYLQSICIEKSDPEKRLAFLRRATAVGKQDPLLKLALVEALLEMEQLDEAEPILRDILQHEPNNAFALFGMGRIAFAHGDLAGSKQALERSLAQQNLVRGPHLLLSQVYQQLGEENRAEQERQLAAKITVERYWNDPYLDKLFQHEVGETALLKRAERLSLSGNPAGAERVLLRALDHHPDSAKLHAELGKVWLFFRHLPQAEAELQRAQRLNPNLVNANHYLGMCLRLQKRYAEAIEYQRKALKVQEQLADAWFEIGLCLEAQSDQSGAIQAFREAARHSPEMGSAHKRLGVLLLQSNETAEALQHLQQAAVLLPEDAEVKKRLAEIQPPPDEKSPSKPK